MPLTWAFSVKRVTGIEPALSPWNQDELGRHPADLAFDRPSNDREYPSLTVPNGTQTKR